MKKKEDIDIGNIIRTYRLKRGISQMKLGERIGVSYQQIQKYEKGISSLSIERLRQISKELDIPIESLLKSDAHAVSEPPGEYRRLSPEEEELIRIFRRLKSRNLKKSLIKFLKMIAEK